MGTWTLLKEFFTQIGQYVITNKLKINQTEGGTCPKTELIENTKKNSYKWNILEFNNFRKNILELNNFILKYVKVCTEQRDQIIKQPDGSRCPHFLMFNFNISITFRSPEITKNVRTYFTCKPAFTIVQSLIITMI